LKPEKWSHKIIWRKFWGNHFYKISQNIRKWGKSNYPKFWRWVKFLNKTFSSANFFNESLKNVKFLKDNENGEVSKNFEKGDFRKNFKTKLLKILKMRNIYPNEKPIIPTTFLKNGKIFPIFFIKCEILYIRSNFCILREILYILIFPLYFDVSKTLWKNSMTLKFPLKIIN